MRPAAHLRFLIAMTAVWAVFWVLGWPDYYQSRSFAVLAAGCVLITVAIAWFGAYSLRRVRAERRRNVAVWLSVYATVPFALYDFLYCGIHLELGPGFVFPFWYLSIFYVIPWLLFLPTARLLPGEPAPAPPP